jgi:hypothetical protein
VVTVFGITFGIVYVWAVFENLYVARNGNLSVCLHPFLGMLGKAWGF